VSSGLRMVPGITEWRNAESDCDGAGVSSKGASGVVRLRDDGGVGSGGWIEGVRGLSGWLVLCC
jgi:hypothetical protein